MASSSNSPDSAVPIPIPVPVPVPIAAARESAPYGHACAGCAKAKCRCIGRGGPGNNSCERCHRLRRECQPSAVVRKRLSRRPAANKTARLEEKLDSLVTLLKTQAVASSSNSQQQQQQPPNLTDSPHAQGQDQTETGYQPSLTSLEKRPVSVPITTLNANVPVPPQRLSAASATPSISTTPSSSHFSCDIYPLDPPLSQNLQEDEYLRTFQSHHLKFLPFLYIPPGTTAAHLQRERPFAWLNIRALCCKSASETKQLNRKIREILAQSLLVDLERSLDLLLGLLIYLAWAMNHLEGKKILCAFSNLAISLVIDLRLDRPGQEDPCNETDSYNAFGHPIKQYVPASYRTNEERRAVLACYATCSTIASLLKIQPMRWTSHMEDCLNHLASQPEYPGDEVLTTIAKICKVKDDMNMTASARLTEFDSNCPPRPPPILYIKSFLARIEAVKKEVRADLLENKIIKSYLSNAFLVINNLPLFSQANPNVLPGLAEFGRTECVFACLHAIEQGFDNWFCFNIEELFGMSMAVMLHFGINTHFLYRLSIIEDPAWDRAAVRKALDLIQILERGAERVGSVPQAVGLQTNGGDFFTSSAATLRNAIPMWRRAFANTDATSAGGDFMAQGSVQLGGGGVLPNSFETMDDIFDDIWLPDILTAWQAY
ncbi:hypothetical protein BGZ63DRAFT_379866 [Mariannaea sp. PMI_226]|nr:hypothetical protein BGZ63DRAFT_379866 [Mariannaea sp. PMI_226]